MGKRLLILGAGGHGRVVREVALSLLDIGGKPAYETVDFLDDNSEKAVGKMSSLEKFKNEYQDVLVTTFPEKSY